MLGSGTSVDPTGGLTNKFERGPHVGARGQAGHEIAATGIVDQVRVPPTEPFRLRTAFARPSDKQLRRQNAVDFVEGRLLDHRKGSLHQGCRADQGCCMMIAMPPAKRSKPKSRDIEPSELLTVAEAAVLLGISQPTLRRWDDTGKFPARRHPINGYRMYLKADVMKLRKKIVEGGAA